jgi:hypothetical protein
VTSPSVHESASSHRFPDGWNASRPGHIPDVPVQDSAGSYSLVEGRHVVVDAWKTSTHVLSLPEQWSDPSHAPLFEAPVQLVALVANPFAGQAPDVPVQLSAGSHSLVEGRHVVVDARKVSTHVLSLPGTWQWSACAAIEAPMRSGANPFAGQTPDVPVQLSAGSLARRGTTRRCRRLQRCAQGANPFAGQAPDVPVQDSAGSHSLVEGRQVVVDARKTSTHVLSLPEQWSDPSHAPLFEAPVQLVALEANPFAGQAPDVPVQDSAGSHSLVEGRHVVVDARKSSTHVLSLPEQ